MKYQNIKVLYINFACEIQQTSAGNLELLVRPECKELIFVKKIVSKDRFINFNKPLIRF